MILEALYRLAQSEQLLPDPDFEPKPVAWLVRVGKDGALLGIESTHHIPQTAGRRKPRPVPKPFLVPRQPERTSGDRAFFFCDKAEYALGLDPQKEKTKRRPAAKLTARFGLFRESVRRCAEETGDDGARAVSRFLEGLAAGKVRVTLPDECATNDLFAFVYSPDAEAPVHLRDRIREYWKRQRSAAAAAVNDHRRRCLVTGEAVGSLGNFPTVKPVPGGNSSGVALVSFNQTAFESHGWKGNENALIGRGAAEACATALERLLSPAYPDPRPGRAGYTLPLRNYRISDDTVVCFWAAEGAAVGLIDQLPFLIGADPAKVGDLYRSIWRGRPVRIDDPTTFYAITISGAQGRAMVRDWFVSSVGEVEVNLARHFQDLAMVRTAAMRDAAADLPPVMPLRTLLAALAPPGDSQSAPGWLAAGCVRAALRGTPYPFSLLQRALERARAEAARGSADGLEGWRARERADARAAIIKGVLTRSTPRVELHVDMDPNNSNPGYLLGRLMALIERLQQVALGDVNASVVDRYFAAASATPRAVFTRLLKGARHHASKAKDEVATAGVAGWLDRQIDDVAARFDPRRDGFPAHLDLIQQGLFVLGYHQQRHWLWLSKEARENARTNPAEAPSTT